MGELDPFLAAPRSAALGHRREASCLWPGSIYCASAPFATTTRLTKAPHEKKEATAIHPLLLFQSNFDAQQSLCSEVLCQVLE